MLDCIKLALHHAFPKTVITSLLGWGASKHIRWITKAAIDTFIWYYKVDMQESKTVDTASYHTFNDFFTRSLRDDLYPIENKPELLLSPVNGTISQIGAIQGDQIFQAKGHSYSLLSLLAGNYAMTDLYKHGSFITTYLSPRDYHRVHMPCNAILREMMYIPGDLYAVTPFIARHIPNIFARNERVICRFDTNFGSMAQILIGAAIVGSIETAWLGTITPPREGIIRCWNWPAHHAEEDFVSLTQGEEMGRFKLGSTVINLFSPNTVILNQNLAAENHIRLGDPIAIIR
ncbi:Phosphatidylserine decarboxylase proenzyme [Candidatus Erwinia haradaeae]|uniref:Phosphatidylserine decarboxylase proenzyme n=1 Tax=Candidatus Erwinia haradaeae TaxID=1922217 RepID=A0A451DKA2_9GAMM|nr:archaetidylserine decarboxylase [Candidatus Erwinia haradaeae]VFP87145.1 Phosphatidylserine decarboxylase proenzyme [Candidatus Erwinia haradaeae]